ncbi:MAG: hypothetical protein ACI9U2_000349 [Bradymonadia bacterium]|jgi:hypothetical protein
MRLIGPLTAVALACALSGCDDAVTPPTTDAWVSDARITDAEVADAEMAGPRLIHVGESADVRPPDGSRERPYPTAAGGFAVALPGDVVFLLEGDHPAIDALPAGVELLGAGPDVTRLAGPLALANADAKAGGFTLHSGHLHIQKSATVSDVRVDAAPTPALIVDADASLHQVMVVDALGDAPAVQASAALVWTGGGVANAPSTGVHSEQADLTLTDLDLRDLGGLGVFADGGRHVIRGLRVRGAMGAAARFVEAESEVFDCGMTDIGIFQGTGSGVGIIGGMGAIEGCDIIGVERGLRASLGGQLTARDVHVSRVSGDGLTVNDSTANVDGLIVDAPRSGGVSVIGSTATLRDVTINTANRYGLLANNATVEITGLTVNGSGARGVSVLRSAATMTGVDISDAGDVCIQVTDPEGAVAFDDVRLTNCAGAGLSIFGAGPSPVALSDAIIRDTQAGNEDFVAGVHVYNGEMALTRVDIEGAVGEGIRVDNSAARLDTVRVVGHPAPGLTVLDPTAPVTATGLTAERNGGAGVLIVGGALTLTAPQISGTRPAPEIGPGDGIAAPFQADLTVIAGRSGDNAGDGISIAAGSTATLRDAVSLDANAGWGLQVACGATLVNPSDYRAEENGRGAQSICP